MKLWSLEGNRQWLDGGAMYGNCPRAVWSRWSPPDDRHRIPLACRSLLVREDSGRTLLFETGVGAFFDPQLRERYGIVENEDVLLGSLDVIGITPEEIDVVVLSHLHFDHAGGLLSEWREDRPLELRFPNAALLVSEDAWRRSRDPHPRDRASFIPELPELLEKSGRLECIDSRQSPLLGDRYSFFFSEGHTPGLMLTRIDANEPGPITFMGDLVPGVPWIHVPITMGYDRYPERLIDEKQELLGRLSEAGEWLFLTHDPQIAACRVSRDDRGRYCARDEQRSLRPA